MLFSNTRTVVGEISHPHVNDFELVGLESEDWAAVEQAVPHFLSDLTLVKINHGRSHAQYKEPAFSASLVPKQEASSVQTLSS